MNQNQRFSHVFTAENAKKTVSKLGAILATKKFWVELLIMTLGMFVAAM